MIKLQKSTFYNEHETKRSLCEFITNAEVLSMGSECAKFEIAFAKKQERARAVFVNSGSSANLVLVQSLMNLGRLNRGDVIGVSALTWSTNIMPLIQLGLQPMLIDCEIDTLNISPEKVKDVLKIQPNISAIFITNTLGHCDDIAGIKHICEENDILFFEDNCESLGTIVNGKKLGNWGIASTFSTFVGHHLSTIEGGLICTDDEELAEQMVMVRAHGWDRNLKQEKQKEIRALHDVSDFYSKYTFYDLAFNVRPSEISGFIGNLQINYWDMLVEKRQSNFLRLHEEIKNNKELIDLRVDHLDLISNFAVPVLTKSEASLEKYLTRFSDASVEVRPMIAGNMARQPFYRKYVANPGMQTNSEFVHSCSFYFGNNPELVEDELQLLQGLLKQS